MHTVSKIVNIHGHLRVDCDVDAMVEQWHSENVVKYCLAALPANFRQAGYLGNEEILPWLKKYPGMLAGLGNIDLSEKLDPVSKIEELCEAGFEGLKFIDPAYDYCNERYFGYYDAAQRLGMPILFHTGFVMMCSRPERNIDSGRMRPYCLDRVAREFPDLKIVAAHLGYPHHAEALTLMAHTEHIYCDITGGGGGKRHMASIRSALKPYHEAGTEQEMLDEIFDKLLFGTDSPPVSVWLNNSLQLMEEFGVSQNSRENFFWRNAAKLFGWEL